MASTTWTSGFLHDHDKNVELRHLASRQLCYSDNEVTLYVVLMCCDLVKLHTVLSKYFTVQRLLSAKHADFDHILPIGMRQKLKKALAKCVTMCDMDGSPVSPLTPFLIELPPKSVLFLEVTDYMKSTIRRHANDHSGRFRDYLFEKVQLICNSRLWERYAYQRTLIRGANNGDANEHMLFHGSTSITKIIEHGMDEKFTDLSGMFGAGLYHADVSSKSNLYVFGEGGGNGCQRHWDKACPLCSRQLLLCRVSLGRARVRTTAREYANPPPNHDSVVGKPYNPGLDYPEFAVYRGDQTFPQFLITYKLKF